MHDDPSWEMSYEVNADCADETLVKGAVLLDELRGSRRKKASLHVDAKSSSPTENRRRRQDLPTPESPISSSLNRNSPLWRDSS